MTQHDTSVGRYDSLDAWRGVACLFVVLFHSTLPYVRLHPVADAGLAGMVVGVFDQLSIGVQMFFVISGYCIAASAYRSSSLHKAPSAFFMRRFQRIYPPLWIATVVGIALFVIFDTELLPGILSNDPFAQLRPWWFSPSQWAGNLTLTETWRHHVWGDPRAHFLQQSWTLAYEEQFYMLMGLLLFASQWLFSGVIAISLFTLAMMATSRATGVDFTGFFFDGSWLMFAAGVFIFYAGLDDSKIRSRICAAAVAAGAILSLVVPMPGGPTGYCFALLLLLLHPFDRKISSARVIWPLVLCGQMCYSLYLVHQLPVKMVSAFVLDQGVTTALGTLMVTVPVSVMIAVSAGWIFHRTVEVRFYPSATGRPREPEPIPDDLADLESLGLGSSLLQSEK